MAQAPPTYVAHDIPYTVAFYVEALGARQSNILTDSSGAITHGEVMLYDQGLAFTPDDRGPGAAHLPWRMRALKEKGPRGAGLAMQIALDDEDLGGLCEHARAQGAKVILEPEDQVWGVRVFAVEDPDGYPIYVTTPINRN
jgi:uncharacterized glyoxalase superfamily protein PhnB